MFAYGTFDELVESLLIVRRTLREQIGIVHRRLLAVVKKTRAPPSGGMMSLAGRWMR
jgi:hypothetical protein